MEMIEVPGARLSSLALGHGKESPVAMLHGLVAGNMAQWYFGAALSLSASRRVVLYDQRGHGESSLPSDSARARFDLDSQVADLRAVLAHHQLADKAIDLVGHSMGALIALRFALRHMQQLRHLVLVDAPMPACDYVAPGLRIAAGDLDSTQLPLGAAGLPHPAAQGRRQQRQRRRIEALISASSLIDDVHAMGPESDEQLAKLDRPVLLIYGSRSPCLPAAYHLQRVLPRCELALLDCGHYVLEEAPEALRQQLEAFLPVGRA
jgi:pimeloyl-ACP methyl ester carboxylesterase